MNTQEIFKNAETKPESYTLLGDVQFRNGDKVKYAHGLTFVFIGLDPFDSTNAYCIHPTAICQDQPNLKYKRVDKLPLDRLTHCT